MRIAIVDDEKNILNLLYEKTRAVLAEEDETAEISLFSSGEELLTVYQKQEKPFDILLLDIQLDKLDGMKTAELIRAKDKDVLILFITSSAEYVFRGYEVKAFRYLMKTELAYGFSMVLRDTIKELKNENKPSFRFQFGAETIVLETERIYYFESIKRVVQIVLSDKTYKTYAKLADIEATLANQDFIRCHQSFLVNAKKIEKLNGLQIVLKNGMEIPISKRYRKAVSEGYLWTLR